MIYCVKAISFLISHIATFWYLPKVMRTRKLFTSPQTQTNPSNLPRWHPRADNLFTCFLFFISVLSTFPQKLPFLFLCCNVFTIDRTHYLVMTCICWHDYYSSCNQFLCHMYASVSRRNDNRVFKNFCNFFFFYYMLSRVSRPFLVPSLQLFLHTTCFREKYRNVRFIIRPLGFVLVGDRKFLGLDKLLVISHLSGCDNARITHRQTQTLAGIHKHTYTGALIHWYKDAYTYHIWQIHMHT